MASKTFQTGTVIDADWLNDVNRAVYHSSATTPEAYGAVGDGVTNDGAAIREAIADCCVTGKMLVFSGSYAVDYMVVQDAVYNFTMYSANAQFFGIATTPQNALLELVNCVDFHMTGNWRFQGADNANYAMGLFIRAQTGTSQAVSRVNIYNPTFRNFKIGMGAGRYDVDYQCSEITVYGANFFKCPIAIYNGGLNTGVQYVGGNLVSEPNPAFSSTPEKWLWQEGGFVKVVGGSVFTNPTANYGVLFSPCSSASGNVYGTLNVEGTHVEMNSPLLRVVDDRGLGTTISDAASVSFNGCAGFSGAPAAADFVFVADSTYAGLLSITNSNWYSAPVRTGYNISSASPLVKIVTDKTSLGKNFRNWMSGVFSGKLIHDMQAVVNAYGPNTTYTSGTTSTIKFLNNSTTGDLGRYGSNYDPATGLFIVPAGGFSRLDISVGIAGTVGVTGDFYLTKNGAIVAFGPLNTVGSIQTTLYDLAPGDSLAVKIAPSANYTCDGGMYNFLHISGATA